MKEFKGVNGDRIVINSTSMANVKDLRKCFARELLKQNIDINNVDSLAELKKQLTGTVLISLIKNVLCSLECSEEFDRVMNKCLLDCTYRNIAITEQLFDDIVEAREDYDTIRLECIKENLSPFFKKVVGLFKVQEDLTDKNQPQK